MADLHAPEQCYPTIRRPLKMDQAGHGITLHRRTKPGNRSTGEGGEESTLLDAGWGVGALA